MSDRRFGIIFVLVIALVAQSYSRGIRMDDGRHRMMDGEIHGQHRHANARIQSPDGIRNCAIAYAGASFENLKRKILCLPDESVINFFEQIIINELGSPLLLDLSNQDDSGHADDDDVKRRSMRLNDAIDRRSGDTEDSIGSYVVERKQPLLEMADGKHAIPESMDIASNDGQKNRSQRRNNSRIQSSQIDRVENPQLRSDMRSDVTADAIVRQQQSKPTEMRSDQMIDDMQRRMQQQ